MRRALRPLFRTVSTALAAVALGAMILCHQLDRWADVR
jgi:hypothetical protein